MHLVGSKYGPTDSTTRLVLFGLSLHMNSKCERCWPSQALIAAETALSIRCVRDHLEIAELGGWITRKEIKRPGKAWFFHKYTPTFPESLAPVFSALIVEWTKNRDEERAELDSSRHAREELSAGREPINDSKVEQAANDARRPANDDATTGTSRHNARNQLPTNSSSNSSSNYQSERAPRAPGSEQKFSMIGVRNPSNTAGRLHDEGKSDSEIAGCLRVEVAQVGRWISERTDRRAAEKEKMTRLLEAQT